ncbi:MAG: MaoC/PaaZ C-terminal domain-containing protein [Anaerolineae bacterium]|nr:MaoC/PaaZ C-terminal domain-containing protein [Anaerolineae bacterium]
MTVPLDVVNAAIGKALPSIQYTFTQRDTAIYAMGVGAPSDWLDPDELKFVYELHGGFCALPTMPVIYSGKMIDDIIQGDIQGIKFNPMMLVHGEQSLDIKAPLPIEGTITCIPKIRSIHDKGSGMLIATEVSCTDENGTLVAVTSGSMFIRGLGGFGGERGSSEKIEMPDRAPDIVHEELTLTKQALLYRLNGDINPLHADPAMAKLGNFETPILHGLATYGFAGRAVLKHFAGNDPSRFKQMTGRFTREVYPGNTLATEMWQEPDGVYFQTKAKERDVVVIGNGRVIIG